MKKTKTTIAWMARDHEGSQVFKLKPRFGKSPSYGRNVWFVGDHDKFVPVDCAWLCAFPVSAVKPGECKKIRITVEVVE